MPSTAFAPSLPLALPRAPPPISVRFSPRPPPPLPPRSSLRPPETAPRPGRDFHGIPNPPAGTALRLGDLRGRLIRQEETIIFALIERAQFRRNAIIYAPGAFAIAGAADGISFSQYVLYGLEKVYAQVRRYTSPDEHPFSPLDSLPQPVLESLEYPATLIRNAINYNKEVERMYCDSILPVVCEDGDDQNYGSSATCDVAVLQALSKRIHYGKFIAEAKFQESPAEYSRLSKAGDRDGIWELLSNVSVEEVLLRRVENKAINYGADVSDKGAGRENLKVQPEAISSIYREFIIPLTKEVEVDYIIERARRLENGDDSI